MTEMEHEWNRLFERVKSATTGSLSISENCLGLRRVAVEFKTREKRYQITFGGKPEADFQIEDPPTPIRWVLQPTREGSQISWFVAALDQTLTTRDLAVAISDKLNDYSFEYENEIAFQTE